MGSLIDGAVRILKGLSGTVRLLILGAMIVCVVSVVNSVKSCRDIDTPLIGSSTVVVPKDTNFAPVTHIEYRPPSISKGKFKSKLPSNVSEKDVEKITTIEFKDTTGNPSEIDIIETKDGNIYIPKLNVSNVKVVHFVPPVLQFDPRFGIGISYNTHGQFAPLGTFSFLRWYGWIDAPVVMVDVRGAGLGVQGRLYHDINLGIGVMKEYDSGLGARATISFTF